MKSQIPEITEEMKNLPADKLIELLQASYKKNQELTAENQNRDAIIHGLIDQCMMLKDRLDVALNAIAVQKEEIQRLKDEIANLKGQKPRPKIPPSILEGPHSKDKEPPSNKMDRGKHPRP